RRRHLPGARERGAHRTEGAEDRRLARPRSIGPGTLRGISIAIGLDLWAHGHGQRDLVEAFEQHAAQQRRRLEGEDFALRRGHGLILEVDGYSSIAAALLHLIGE